MLRAAAALGLLAGLAAAKDEFLMLVQQWPPAFGSSIDHFTLHGNWMSYTDGSYPSFCTQDKFDLSKVQGIEDRLNEYWPSLMGSGGNVDFWTHEYEKHGTCATNVPELDGEFNFFNGTLAVRGQYAYRGVLGSAGFQPGSSVATKDVSDAIRSAIGADVGLGCYKGKLETVTTCLSLNLQPIDCPSYVFSGNYGNCQGTVQWPAANSADSLAAGVAVQ